MAYSVSSAFLAKVRQKSVTGVRRFIIGNSDYSGYVKSWPKISRGWNEIKSKSATVKLANTDQALGFLYLNPHLLNTQCYIKMGVVLDTGSEETFNVFQGTIGKTKYSGDGSYASVTIVDKFKSFTERVVGGRDTQVSYLNSNYLVSDIAWWAITSYGGLSNITSTSNPDIDYGAFSKWANIFSSSFIYVNAVFDGQKVVEVLRKIGRMTGSNILEENGQITFSRFDIASTAPFQLNSADVIEASAEIDNTEIVNKQIVNAAFDITSKEFNITVFDVVTYSVDSYGLREQIEEDQKIWYINSASALDFAQKVTILNKEPYKTYGISTGIQPSARQVGETVSFSHGLLGVNNAPFRMTNYTVDVDKFRYELDLDASALLLFFVLDDSYLGILDQTYNVLG